MVSTVHPVVCGCGREVPEAVADRAVRENKGLRCRACGARANPITIKYIRAGRRICGRCGVFRCPDGCCCAC